ncbi:MAG: hypothetical protein H0U75_11145 [Legionella sp.]|nr:hypothetical protein [Legionella sp.]
MQKSFSELAFGNKKNSSQTADLQQQISEKGNELKRLVAKVNGYLYIDFQIISYPDEANKLYLTIEIIDKKHPDRLRFLNETSKTTTALERKVHKDDVIESMIRYQAIALDLILQQKFSYPNSCPVYHCILGFDHPKLISYLPIFNQGVINNKALIIETLKHDGNTDRREAAAFLVGHFSDPNEILTTLLPFVDDKVEGVRNNAMRVIGSTIAKSKISNFDIHPFLNVLDSPYATDRNKALYIIFVASKSKPLGQVINQKERDTLVSLLRLKQPNNHDWAYLILKNITGKDFGPQNVTAWRKNLKMVV